MELHPDYTKENLNQIGKKEGLALLQDPSLFFTKMLNTILAKVSLIK